MKTIEELLLAASCPNSECDGYGAVPVVHAITVAGCCGSPTQTGECCGDPIPVQEQECDWEPCQWCHDRALVLGKPELLIRKEIPPKILEDIDNEIPF